LIQVEDLRFTYAGGETPALNGIDLRVNQGDFMLLTGESGSGKTTLARILAGVLGSEDGDLGGSVRFEDIDWLDEIGPSAVGLVQQDPESQVVTLRVEDEVAFGPENLGLDRGEIQSRIKWALGSVGAGRLQGRRVSSLSGGELQKVAIASILALKPRVLILDEPSSSLDLRSAFKLSGVLGSLNSRGMTIIVVEHHYSWVIERVKEVMKIEEGRLVRGKRPVKPATRESPAEPSFNGEINLSLREVRFDYGGKSALSGVTMDLHRGEIIGLMGDNGSGKSTLLLMVMGFLRPSAGSISIEGQPVAATSRIARRVGIVFQNPNHQILESTVRSELLFGPRNFGFEHGEADRMVGETLEETGLSRYANENPHRLSMGEKRRVNVGSVTIYGPAIYLLDEPFVGQDPGNTSRIMKILRSRVETGSSCLISTHDPDFALRNCNRIAFLREGALAHLGRPLEVFKRLQKEGEDWYLPNRVNR